MPISVVQQRKTGTRPAPEGSVRGEADRRCVCRRATEIQQRPGPSGSVTFDSSLARFPDEGNRGHGLSIVLVGLGRTSTGARFSTRIFRKLILLLLSHSLSLFLSLSLSVSFSHSLFFLPSPSPIIRQHRNEFLLCDQDVLADCQD